MNWLLLRIKCYSKYIISFLQGKEKIKSMRELLVLLLTSLGRDRIGGKGKMSGRRRRICWDAPRLQDGWRINRDWTQWSDEYMKCPNNPSLSHEFHYVLSSQGMQEENSFTRSETKFLNKWFNIIAEFLTLCRIKFWKKNIVTLDGAVTLFTLTLIIYISFLTNKTIIDKYLLNLH